MVDERSGGRLVEQIQRRFPGVPALLIRVRPDRDAPDAQAAEEQRCRVELGNLARQPPDHTDASAISERRDQLVEKRAADVVDCQVNFALA